MNIQQLENELWEAADQLRANSKLTAAEYSMPVLGLIFLRHADNRFKAYLPEIEANIPPQILGDEREGMIKLGFQSKAAIYLPEQARFDRIANLPQGEKVGEVIDAAMDAVEAEYPVLSGALPRGYAAFEPELLAELIKILDRPAIKQATGDLFGRIYEYFLNKFAMSGAQEGGEFFTPPSLVRMIVNVIEPDHGLILDPACGSAGMFVQTGHFIEDVRHAAVNDSVTFYGQEKSDTNTKLARMNLVVHGLDASNIRQGNTFYDQIEHLVGQCDFVMANPPFNVDGVDTKKVQTQVKLPAVVQENQPNTPAPQANIGRLPFGLPGTNAKTGAISNANSLWIQYFYSYLNNSGRAGFVMASSASDAGNKDRDIREQLVKTGHVDAMLAIGNKFFYTRSLPCTLWFFDKGKNPSAREHAFNDTHHVLMIDARNVYHVVSSRSHIFTEEQLANLNAIVWLYRGEADKFTALVNRYQRQVTEWLISLPKQLRADSRAVLKLAAKLRRFSRKGKATELLEPLPLKPEPTASQQAQWQAKLAARHMELDSFNTELAAALADTQATEAIAALLAAAANLPLPVEGEESGEQVAEPSEVQTQLDALLPQLKATGKALEARHKQWLKLLDTAEKTLNARQSQAFDNKAIRAARRDLLASDLKKNEAPTVRDAVLAALKQTAYFISQGHWLLSRFPDARFTDVPGLCKAVTLDEIAANDYSLTPGRYVGVAVNAEQDDDDFAETMRDIHDELAELNDKATELAARIARNFEELLA